MVCLRAAAGFGVWLLGRELAWMVASYIYIFTRQTCQALVCRSRAATRDDQYQLQAISAPPSIYPLPRDQVARHISRSAARSMVRIRDKFAPSLVTDQFTLGTPSRPYLKAPKSPQCLAPTSPQTSPSSTGPTLITNIERNLLMRKESGLGL